jgi:hypothetical protein
MLNLVLVCGASTNALPTVFGTQMAPDPNAAYCSRVLRDHPFAPGASARRLSSSTLSYYAWVVSIPHDRQHGRSSVQTRGATLDYWMFCCFL